MSTPCLTKIPVTAKQCETKLLVISQGKTKQDKPDFKAEALQGQYKAKGNTVYI